MVNRIPRLYRVIIAIAVIAALCLTVEFSTVLAKEAQWNRYDVTLDINADGTLTVTEDQSIAFSGGSFSQGYAVIPLSRVEDITSVEVSEDGRQYDRATSGSRAGTFTVQQVGGEIKILWRFTPNQGDESRQFTIQYRVEGGLRVYPETNREQLWWRAIDEDFAGDISAATVTVNLPGPVAESDIAYSAYTRGFSEDSVRIERLDDSTLRWSAENLQQGDALEARVEFPKLTSAVEPSWQAGQEAAEERAERLKPYKALANALLLGVGGLLVIGSPIGMYGVWRRFGRDEPVPIPIDLLREPPDDLPPGTVGTLIDERADIHDLIATMVDLGERGFIQIEETSSELLGFSYNRDWKVQRLDQNGKLSAPEQAVLSALMGGAEVVYLSKIKKRFGRSQKSIKAKMYAELVQHGYFATNPETVRKYWKTGGLVILGGAAFVGFSLWNEVSSFAPMFVALLVGLAVAGLAVLAASQVMPRKTQKGAEAAARWLAFRRYLVEIEKYQDMDEARQIFSNYLPYAVAFGIEKSWVRKFSRLDTPAPHWYGPRYPHRHGNWGGGPIRPGNIGGGGGFDPPSMQDVSDSFSGSLQSMSDGLFSMFDEASDVFKPYSESSSSGGGGGFSGGGGSFGGGGGGGGRGFS